jgi:N-acetylated-alpha-linked acidic dipeptidase
MDYAVRPIWNVIATLRGSEEPDRWVVLGNHRDAWTYGAVDPYSGTAAMLETARALGEAVRAG